MTLSWGSAYHLKYSTIRETSLKITFFRTSQAYLEYRTYTPRQITLQKAASQKEWTNCSFNITHLTWGTWSTSSWKIHLNKTIYAYNCTRCSSTGYSPYCHISLGKPIDSYWFKMSCLSCLVFICVHCFFLKMMKLYKDICSAWISRTSAEIFFS